MRMSAVAAFVVLVGLSLFGMPAQARADIGVSDHSISGELSNLHQTSAPSMTFYLGTGISGTLTSVKNWFEKTAGSNIYNLSWQGIEFDNETCYDYYVANTGFGGCGGSDYRAFYGGSSLTISTNGVQELNHNLGASSGRTFFADKWYVVIFNGDNYWDDGRNYRWLGSASQEYFGGYLKTPSPTDWRNGMVEPAFSLGGLSCTGCGVVADTSTRFISVTPAASSTVATSTTVGAHVYINESDFATGMVLHMSFSNQTVANVGGSALDAWCAAFGGCSTGGQAAIEIELSSGDNDVATSTVFPIIGRTIGDYKILRPDPRSRWWLIGGLFGDDEIISTTTSFVVVQRTGVDIAVEAGGQALVDALLTGTTSVPVLDCDIGTFDLQLCLISIVVPSMSTLKYDFENFRNTIFRSFPLKYADMLIEDLSGSSTTTPPALTYTFGSSSPAELQGKTYSIQIYDHFDVLEEIRTDDGENKNLWDIVMPYFEMITAFAVLGVILFDLFGIAVDRGEGYLEGRIEKREMFKKSVREDINKGNSKW